MKNMRRFLALALAGVMAFSSSFAGGAAEVKASEADVTDVFSDVYQDWYTDYVQYVYDNSLMTGIKGTDEFQPSANITKAQVAQVLYNMEDQPEVDLGSAKAFKELVDVYDAEWYASAVAWAYETGVVTGDLNEKKFSPNADVTREQLALMIYRYAKHKGYDVSASSDFAGLANADKVADWSMDGMKWAVGKGLISGAEKNGVKDLDPQGNAQRAQVAAILMRFCEAYPGTEEPTPEVTEVPQPTETEVPVPTETEAPQPTETEVPVPTETEAPQPTEAPADPADDSMDIPVENYTPAAGSTQPGNTPSSALDGNQNSFWEVAWGEGGRDINNLWYQIELNEATKVEALRYLPRYGADLMNGGDANGFITGYRVEVSMDAQNWETVATGTWERSEGWKLAEFDEPVMAKYVKLVATATWAADGINTEMSIAEIRVKAAKDTEEPTPEVTEVPQPTETEAPVPTETEAPQPTVTEAPEVTETPVVTPEVTETPAVPEEPTVEVDENLPKAGSISVSAENVTEGQPFASGTADCAQFRIPAFITLDNGDLLAAADARWRGGADWGGLDTIASVSEDNGETWSYSFPIWFPDSDETIAGTYKVATTAIDPVVVQGNDGTIYCIADMNPSGITTGDIMPAPELGYVEIDGTMRLVLTDTYTQPTSRNWATYGDPDAYEYYVGDFNEDGFAKVIKKADKTETDWLVDEWYNIYKLDKEANAYKPLTQNQVVGTETIQQNAFYKDSELHVFNTGYLWLVTSKDNGKTWGDPTILNTQIKREGEVALLASPGQGMVASNGDIIIPFYDHGDNQENASIIWSSDNGKTWTRSNDVAGMWSSESEMVEINNGVLRLFFRNGQSTVCYADFTKTGDTWVAGTAVNTGIPACSTCNVTAIRYSEKINDKVVIMVGYPGGSGRANGKIATFLVNEDNSMELFNVYSVNEGYYAYSCMSELENGNIGLLWENQGTRIRYDEIDADVVLGLKKVITVDAGGEAYVEEEAADALKEITEKPDETIATVTSELVVEDFKTLLHDHTGNQSGSLGSFAEEANVENALEKAEVVLTHVSDNSYKVYNPYSGKYLYKDTSAHVKLGDNADAAAGQLSFTAVSADGGVSYRICRASDNARYTVFYYINMDFNSMNAYDASWGDGSYDLVLLEKQDKINYTDIIPGYTRAEGITSGNTYLIAYILGAKDVIILDPNGGSTGAQAKLVGETVELSKNVITITGLKPGKTTATIDGVVYEIIVEDPTLRADYAGNDIDVAKLKATAGAAQSGAANEGPAELALDGNPGTHFHSAWSPKCTDDQLWIALEIDEATAVTGLRYLPRTGAGNGTVNEYEIFVSDDGTEWESVATGKWELDAQWKMVRFEEPITTKYVKLFAVDSTGDSVGRHMSAAEVRLTTIAE